MGSASSPVPRSPLSLPTTPSLTQNLPTLLPPRSTTSRTQPSHAIYTTTPGL